MIEYFNGEVQVMKEIKADNMVKLYEVKDDNEFYYMFMEYCDGGDLVNLQAQEKKKVFSL